MFNKTRFMDDYAWSRSVKQWVKLLPHQIELKSRFGAIRSRGTVKSREARTEFLEEVFEMLMLESAEVRLEAIAALGEEGDPLSFEVLRQIAKSIPQRDLGPAVVTELLKSRQPLAIDILLDLAQSDYDEDVRAEAIHPLGNLALISSPAAGMNIRGTVRTRGAVRVRGIAPSKSTGLSREASTILELLDRI